MKKLFTLVTLMLCMVTGAWAQTVVFSYNGNGTTTATSPSVGSSAATGDKAKSESKFGNYCMKLESSMSNGVYFTLTPTQTLVSGTTITVGAFMSNNSSERNNKVQIEYYDAEGELLTTQYTTQITGGGYTGNNMNSNGTPTDEILNVPAAAVGATTIRIGRNGNTNLWVSKFIVTVPASGKEPSTFALTSNSSIELWKGETSEITYSGNVGTVTFSSNNTSVATVDAGVITAVAEGTASITVTDPGSDAVDGASQIITVIVKEHKNTTTTSIPAMPVGTKGLIHNSHRATDNKSATLEAVATVYDMTGSGGVQEGSTQTFSVNGETGLTGVKLSGSRRIGIRPAGGVTISKVTCYVRSNSDATTFKKYYDASGNAKNLDSAIDVPASTADDPAVIDVTEYISNGFRFESQVQAVFLIEYSRVSQMGVTIMETGYATLYTDCAVTIPEGVTAYTAKLNDAKDAVKLTVVSTTIPKNTAVILHTETPGSYSFVATDDVDAIANNDLIGVTETTAVAANSVYTLGLGSDGIVGMRLYSGTSIRAYSAYMNAPASARGFLGFGAEDVTAIENIVTPSVQDDGVFYDLSGRRVAHPTKGLYIVNGKKVIVK